MKPIPKRVVFGGGKCRFGGAEMRVVHVAEYRLYCLDGLRKVASGEWIEAEDDDAAIEVARKTHDGYVCELWQGKRMVARLDLRRKA
jgi:hypothetical protein